MENITVSLTINDVCNMECPHCYLNLSSLNRYIEQPVLSRLASPQFMEGVTDLVVVGKEPLANKRSIAVLDWLARNLAKEIGFSIITNGIGLPKLCQETARRMNEVCLSLDGGPETYERFRGMATLQAGWSWQNLVQSVRSLQGVVPFAILHTISSDTCDIDDMMRMEELAPTKILFSPFVPTSDVTDQSLRALSVEELFILMSQSRAFMAKESAHLVLGEHSVGGLSRNVLRDLRDKYRLQSKVRWLGSSERYVRFTHDGRFLSSKDALDMSSYVNASLVSDFCSVAQFMERR